MLARTEIEVALQENRLPKLLPAATIDPKETIRKCQHTLIESSTGLVILTDKPDGLPLAVLTLHDLLRTQVSMSEREG